MLRFSRSMIQYKVFAGNYELLGTVLQARPNTGLGRTVPAGADSGLVGIGEGDLPTTVGMTEEQA